MDTQALIVRQVAFKGAIELLAKNGSWDTATVRDLTDQFEKIILNEEKA